MASMDSGPDPDPGDPEKGKEKEKSKSLTVHSAVSAYERLIAQEKEPPRPHTMSLILGAREKASRERTAAASAGAGDNAQGQAASKSRGVSVSILQALRKPQHQSAQELWRRTNSQSSDDSSSGSGSGAIDSREQIVVYNRRSHMHRHTLNLSSDIPPGSNMAFLTLQSLPEPVFDVTKRLSYRRRQARKLKLSRDGIQNIRNSTVTSTHRYQSVSCLGLHGTDVVVISYEGEHNYYYEYSFPMQLVQAIVLRLSLVEEQEKEESKAKIKGDNRGQPDLPDEDLGLLFQRRMIASPGAFDALQVMPMGRVATVVAASEEMVGVKRRATSEMQLGTSRGREKTVAVVAAASNLSSDVAVAAAVTDTETETETEAETDGTVGVGSGACTGLELQPQAQIEGSQSPYTGGDRFRGAGKAIKAKLTSAARKILSNEANLRRRVDEVMSARCSGSIAQFLAQFPDLRKEALSAQSLTSNLRLFCDGLKDHILDWANDELFNLASAALGSTASDVDVMRLMNSVIEKAVENAVIGPLCLNLWNVIGESMKEVENTVSDAIKRLKMQGCSQEHFGVRAAHVSPSGWSESADILRSIGKERMPSEKLRVLLSAVQRIFTLFKEENDARGHVGEAEILSGDDFLPIFIYVVVQSQIVMPFATAEFCWQLCDPAVLASEGGYYVSVFMAALEFLRNGKADEPALQSQSQSRSAAAPGADEIEEQNEDEGLNAGESGPVPVPVPGPDAETEPQQQPEDTLNRSSSGSGSGYVKPPPPPTSAKPGKHKTIGLQP